MKFKGKIRGLSQFYKPDNLERFEIDLYLKDISDLGLKDSTRLPFNFLIGNNVYKCGVRYLDTVGAWMCPDLSDSNGKRIRLSDIIAANNFQNNQVINLEYNNLTRTIIFTGV